MNGLLVDENIPASLVLPTKLPIVHATTIAVSPTDSVLWRHAIANRFVIVAKDADFTHRILLSSPPPWIVHVRLGNLRLRGFIARLGQVWPQAEALLPRHKLVTVWDDRIEAVE